MVFDTDQNEAVESLAPFDPTPQLIRLAESTSTIRTARPVPACGLRFMPRRCADGRIGLGLGRSCRRDEPYHFQQPQFRPVPPAVTNDFHPMKGLMVTQTLQDIVGHELFHWRGDRLASNNSIRPIAPFKARMRS
ncbi:MAG: hypothetical protein U1G07_09370 [Verrucomicrobiota bacterium]